MEKVEQFFKAQLKKLGYKNQPKKIERQNYE